MAEVLDWQNVGDPGQVIAAVVEALSAGELAVFPTETGYQLAASALVPDAVDRLSSSNGSELVLALRGAEELADWLDTVNERLRRLLRRCWPGPLAVRGGTTEQGLAAHLPEPVRRRLSAGTGLTFTVPRHESLAWVLQHLTGPLVLTAIQGANGAELDDAYDLLQVAGNSFAWIVRDEPSRFRGPATLVEPQENGWQVIREGALSRIALERLSCCIILFVCTGNTCRSPLAEAFCKKMLAERLSCPVDDLPQRGFLVLSAGLSAMIGGGPALEAIETATEFGADLSRHASRLVTNELAAQADYLFVMTRHHLQAYLDRFGGLGVQPRLLSLQGEDVPDPIGAGREVYRECGEQIHRLVEEILPEVLHS